MFWGITCEGGKKYSQVAEEPFCITLAALEPRDVIPENKQVSLMVEHKGKEFLLCTLEYDRVMQCVICLQFDKGEETYLFVNGEGTIHLSGYLLTQQSFIDDSPGCSSSGVKSSQISYLRPTGSDGSEDGDQDLDRQENEDEELVGTKRLLTLDDSDEEDSGEEWQPGVETKEDGSGRHVAFADRSLYDDDDDDDDSDVVLASDDETSEDIEEEEEEAGSPEIEIKEELVDDDDVQEVETFSNGKRKKSLPTPVFLKKPRNDVSHASPSTSMDGLSKKRKSRQKCFADGIEQVLDDDSEEQLNSSIGRTPMPSKKSGFLKSTPMSSTSDSSPFLKPGPSGSGTSGLKSALKQSSRNDSRSQEYEIVYTNKLPSGVQYKDIRTGNGPIAKPGKHVHVYYVGRLANNQIFDSVKEGGNSKPFAFRLGKQHVISGLDEAVAGMHVGGKRLIKIPPHMGYGKKSKGVIPPNSTLLFTVDLKAVT